MYLVEDVRFPLRVRALLRRPLVGRHLTGPAAVPGVSGLDLDFGRRDRVVVTAQEVAHQPARDRPRPLLATLALRLRVVGELLNLDGGSSRGRGVAESAGKRAREGGVGGGRRGSASHLRLEIGLGLLLAPQLVRRRLLLARKPLLERTPLLVPSAAPLLQLGLGVDMHMHMCQVDVACTCTCTSAFDMRCICSSAHAVHMRCTRGAHALCTQCVFLDLVTPFHRRLRGLPARPLRGERLAHTRARTRHTAGGQVCTSGVHTQRVPRGVGGRLPAARP